MKNLEKINNIWSDLDKSYETMKLPNEDIKDFFKRIAGICGEGRDAFDYLESRMMEEMDTYDTKELETYNNLVDLFKRIKKASNYGLDYINDSLNEVIHEGVFSEKGGVVEIDANVILGMRVDRKIPERSILEVPLNQCYDLTGSLGDSSCVHNGKCTMVHVKDPHAIVFSGSDLYMSHLCAHDGNQILKVRAAKYVTSLLKSGKPLEDNYIFLDKEYYHINNEKIYLDVKGCNNYCNLKNAKALDNGYEFQRKIGGIPYNIVCFLQL